MVAFFYSQGSCFPLPWIRHGMQWFHERLASAGYAVFGMDYEGHGRSRGARCYIKKFDNIINDCDNFFKSICAQEEYRDKGRFLYGESMGGAVALLLHKKDPRFWNGAVLVAPMCKISEKVKPHPVVVNILTRVEEIIPKWKIVPTKDVIDTAFKDPVKREEIRSNKLIYQDKPRLKTALEMLRTSMNLEDTLHEVRMPFFVLHGEADSITEPEVSKALYQKASSEDKSIKLYPGMWHGLTSGEPDYNIEIVFADIIAWLDRHIVTATTINSTTEVAVGPMDNIDRNDNIIQIDHCDEITKSTDHRGNHDSRGRFRLCGWKKGSRVRFFHQSAM
ncbi:caffeoylshikimate esterase isoform X2 [Carica papaya]|uniref:caffeoylshikimate esterase isoform X2 n=1 Tax=Carica papaya TaxID=3649 RepID=UPI000B8CE500|nr:caffeoylshikimate esterase isoform X2 [Carica papaya]